MKGKDQILLETLVEDIYTQQSKDEPLTKEQMIEAQTLADYIEKNINIINPEMNYKTLANAIKIILKDFGSHNMPAFIEEIQKENHI